MNSVTGIDVYYQDSRIGRLELIGGSIDFSYTDEFIETGIELSPIHLPLSRGVKSNNDTRFDGLHGLFYDNLPDRYGRAAYDRFCSDYSFMPSSILDHLAYVGSSGIGALSFRPASYESPQEPFRILDAIKDSKSILEEIDTKSVSMVLLKSSQIGGAHPKFNCFYRDGSEVCYCGGDIAPKGYRHAIFKFATDKYDNGLLLEHCFTLLAGECGIDIPKTEVIRNEHGIHILSYRFDINSDGYPVHTHSLCGVAHMDFTRTHNYEEYLATTMELTRDMRQVIDAFKRAVFNIVIHNTDDHTKNFSFLMDLEQHWTLSPHYDIVCCREPGHTLRIGGKTSNFSRQDFLRMADLFNIPIEEASRILDEVASGVQRFDSIAKENDLEGASRSMAVKYIASGISSVS